MAQPTSGAHRFERASRASAVVWAFSVFMFAFPFAVNAQISAASTLRGTVFDSLFTSAPLRDAEVFLDGTPLTAITDSLGRFVFEGLAPGTYDIGFGHPMLDSLGFASARRRVVLREGETTVQLGPPSDLTLYRSACAATSAGDDIGLLMGAVRRADDGAPIGSAEVRAEWKVSRLALGSKDAFEARPVVVAARTDATGRYQLCGVPTDVAVVVRASSDALVSGAVRVDLRGRLFASQQMEVGAPAADVRALLVAGMVRRTDGMPIPDAIVRVIGEAVDTKSNSEGRYTLALPRAGTVTLEGRAIGFEPLRVVVAARQGSTASQPFVLTPMAPQLADLDVIADETGFNRRRTHGTPGIFVTPAQIRRMKPERTEDAIRLASHVTFPAGFARPQILMLRGGSCVPTIFIDGRPIDDARHPLWLAPADVRGIEIYDKASVVPPELATQTFLDPVKFLSSVQCAVFIWSWRSAKVAASK